MSNQYLETERISVALKKEYHNKSILDIGGGGEGIIGHIYGNRVIAIDKREDELLETNNEAIKVVMDGTALKFVDETFDVVTLFFSMMYMGTTTQEKVLSEALRVLKKDGILEIWDVPVPKYDGGEKNVFVTHLDVTYPNGEVSTSYGIGMSDEAQTLESVHEKAGALGFTFLEKESMAVAFRLKYKK